MAQLQKITSFLWFDSQAGEAAEFYTGIFKNSRIVATTKYTEAGKDQHKRPPGSVMTAQFELEGQSFTALNGGPLFKFTEAVSFVIHCADQAEVDHYWDKLSAGGDPKAQQCGWLKDKFGLSWQIVPTGMAKMFENPKSKATERAFAAMMEMKKLDIAALKAAYKG